LTTAPLCIDDVDRYDGARVDLRATTVFEFDRPDLWQLMDALLASPEQITVVWSVHVSGAG
jgi:hypothetical protein